MHGTNSSLNLDAAEIMARKANNYVTIKGRKYDRELIKLAEEFTSGKRNAKISINNAKQLLKAVKDNNSYTDIEKHTIEYIRENYKFTEKSDEWFRTEIRKWATEKVQETNNEGAGESIVVDEEEAPNENFPSSWGKDKNDGTSEIPAKDYTNYIPTPSAKPHLKRDKTVPILIFLIGLLVLTGLIYFFWTLFSSENKNRSNELGKTKINVAIVKGKEKSSSVSKMKKTVTEPNSEKLETVKGTIAKVEPKFSWFEKKHELSSNPKFREIESKVIHFEKNSIQIRKEARPGLNRLSRWMKEDSSIRVKIFGHTSLEGTEAANHRVSLLRAETVRDYLAGNGIAKDRFEVIPKGASVPIGDNSKEEGKEMNRRVELRIRN
ncbi:OmpA family protein [Leptospira borgpetersenii]|uniref:OmpA family protein n=1 Tax=Leptospira borgpetersenii serovar Ballum TaxID=280505 RepID=A0A0E3AYK9_LEPBO|nr:OmpA family protein [Leptospira borgpetersenii serovar Ballum]ANH02556.1 OmpA family protein [Leptospira borgpetersenii str. 4E]EKR01027.1 OmpA family protein [Leptospira borgpetersenii serovar Castellonis str. 200801910]EMO11768.1 OmpA family protein [Leptospira borgpetersenii str. Noumea 25]QHE28625.1 OmpA family protein [Leptospira borgpetersenii]